MMTGFEQYALYESAPVYEDSFRLLHDVIVSASRRFISSLTRATTIILAGALLYQARDGQKCYLPQKTGVSWNVRVIPLDDERSPEAIQHK
jgi:hypothetical protein